MTCITLLHITVHNIHTVYNKTEQNVEELSYNRFVLVMLKHLQYKQSVCFFQLKLIRQKNKSLLLEKGTVLPLFQKKGDAVKK